MVERSIIAVGVEITEKHLRVELMDGRLIVAPLDALPKLRDASEAQRRNWRLVGGGLGIHWDEIDEDVSVPALMKS